MTTPNVRGSSICLAAAPYARRRTVLPLLLMLLCSALAVLPAGAAQEAPRVSHNAGVARSSEMASRHWGVPLEVLMAVGYVESRWEQRGGEPSLDGGYGVMHLVDGPGGTLQRGSVLTGLSEEAIKSTAVANIEAGAALLSDISQKLDETKDKATMLTEWFPVVAEYSGASDPLVRDGYARDVFRVIAEGAEATLATGEVVRLAPSKVGALPGAPETPESDDYPPALWVAAHANNYRVGRPYGPNSFIVIHDTEGSYWSAINWFQNPNSGVSAHYVVRSSDGQITQMVRNANTAYHAGNWDYNVRSIGIEHEGYMNQPGWYTEAMYQASSALARHAADALGIKKDRAHFIAHSEVPGATHQDPGPYWNWNYYMSLVRRDSARAALVDNTDAGFTAVPPEIDPQHYWWVHPGGFNNSNTYMTTSVSNPNYSVNSGTWRTTLGSTGNYDVYAFIPYVNNGIPDTTNARYQVATAGGWQLAATSQKAITDRGVGSWAHLGRFYFNEGVETAVKLNDYTGEADRSVWFDAVMWIPTGAPAPPPPPPTNTPTPLPPTNTPTPAPTWTPGPCGMRFWDLPDSHWAYNYISYLYCNGVLSGYADGTVRPGETTTRGQLSKLLALGFGWTLYNPVIPTFSDVPYGSTFYQYVETAYSRGVVSGYSDGTFRPGNAVTRGQVAKMLVLAKSWSLVNPPYPTFIDVPADNWAFGYVETAYSHGIVSGYSNGTFRPGLHVNRAQFAKMLALSLQQQ